MKKIILMSIVTASILAVFLQGFSESNIQQSPANAHQVDVWVTSSVTPRATGYATPKPKRTPVPYSPSYRH